MKQTPKFGWLEVWYFNIYYKCLTIPSTKFVDYNYSVIIGNHLSPCRNLGKEHEITTKNSDVLDGNRKVHKTFPLFAAVARNLKQVSCCLGTEKTMQSHSELFWNTMSCSCLLCNVTSLQKKWIYERVQLVGLISLSCNWAICHNEIDQMKVKIQ